MLTREERWRDAHTMSWTEANRRYLTGEMLRIRAAVARALGETQDIPPPGDIPALLVDRAPAIAKLVQTFGLSVFERDLVLLCAATELDSDMLRKLGPRRPSVGLAHAAFGGDDLTALAPDGPLRRHRIVELEPGPLVAAPLAIDERIVQFLIGDCALDTRLTPYLRELTDSRGASSVAASVRAACDRARGAFVVGLFEGSARERQATACTVCVGLGHRLFRLHANDLPSDSGGRQMFRTLWERELRLQSVALLIEVEDDAPLETIRSARAFVRELDGLTFVSSRGAIGNVRTGYAGFELPDPSLLERVARLSEVAGNVLSTVALERIATQFVIDVDAVDRAWISVGPGEGLEQRLWAACRAQARPQLDDAARRIEPRAGWSDLVVPAEIRATLEMLAGHVRHRAQVYQHWGFASQMQRGLGTGALFAGPSGTGKTLAAEILACEAGLDLYHIDLSQVVNKYVGETEKNLRRVFDAAEKSGAVLLFDEADSLFGKRGEVEKGTDRYANLEVSYLLQRMEAYRGVAILTTNRRDAIDSAFLRRLRFVITFPFPDVSLRAALWERALPVEAPRDRIDCHQLARLQLPGGNIRNVAVNAAFLAAEKDEPISMRHLLVASRAEFVKIERPFPEAEVSNWGHAQ